MPKGDIVIVFDCGATNVRVIAINSKGEILASESSPNKTSPDPFYPIYRIWDVNETWKKLCIASGKVLSRIDKNMIAGVTVTTFGVDGTFFDKNGKILYPVISWQCERTEQIIKNIDRYLPASDLYKLTGVFPFSFNTICKFIWFSENKPEIIENSSIFLFMPSIFSFMLTGEMVNDITMAGTSMLTDLRAREFSSTIFDKIKIPVELTGKPVETGTITGKVNSKASSETGLPKGIPVVATGHDTQFAIFGSGAEINQPVLSSGTWEVLMVRSERFRAEKEQLEMGITTEFDSRPGLYNIGNQWIASGILEWARRTMYSDIGENDYDFLVSRAEKVPHGCNGVSVIPEFNKIKDASGGKILGLTMESTRDDIYRAILEALSAKLALGKTTLEKAGGFETGSILCVGGGSKNRLWNQLRADYSGVPLKIIGQKETTVLGASLFVQAACGNSASPEEARSAIDYTIEIIEPQNIPGKNQ
jgi:L-fuculokinase